MGDVESIDAAAQPQTGHVVRTEHDLLALRPDDGAARVDTGPRDTGESGWLGFVEQHSLGTRAVQPAARGLPSRDGPCQGPVAVASPCPWITIEEAEALALIALFHPAEKGDCSRVRRLEEAIENFCQEWGYYGESEYGVGVVTDVRHFVEDVYWYIADESKLSLRELLCLDGPEPHRYAQAAYLTRRTLQGEKDWQVAKEKHRLQLFAELTRSFLKACSR